MWMMGKIVSEVRGCICWAVMLCVLECVDICVCKLVRGGYTVGKMHVCASKFICA